MPVDVVPVTVNPLTVIQLRDEMVNAFAAPVITGVAPGAAWNVIGEPADPEFAGFTSSWYVPDDTRTVCPATATAAALEIVQNGWLWVPWPESEQPEPPTYRVDVAAAADVTAVTETPTASMQAVT